MTVSDTDEAETAIVAQSRARELNKLGRFDEAEQELAKVYEIQRKLHGERTSVVGTTLVSLGSLDTSRGDYNRAKQRLQLGLEILTEVHGVDNELVAVAFGKMGRLAQVMGEYSEAEQYLLEALEKMRRLLGEHHPEVVNRAIALAGLYRDKGDLDAAEKWYLRAVWVLERHPSPEHLATALNDLGAMLIDRGRFDKAEQCTKRARAIRQTLFGPRNYFVAQSTNNLAEVHRLQGHNETAGPLFEEVLETFEALLGSDHPEVAAVLGNIGLIRHVQGDYAAAEEAFQRAAAIQEAALGDCHGSLIKTLVSHAVTCWARGSTPKALTLLERAGEARERFVRRLLSTGSERQRLASLNLWRRETDVTVSFHVDAVPDDERSLALAFTTVLRRKGRVLDAMARTVGAFHRHLNEPDRELWKKLVDVRARMAAQGDGQRLETLQFEEERLQRELSERSPIYAAETQAASLDQVLSRLPENGALVEFFHYQQVDQRKAESEAFGSSRYVAYVLCRHGTPAWVDLGDGAEIDRLVEAFRKGLANKASSDVKVLARALDERVMQPVRPLLRGAQLILLSPDGPLNLVPFAALVDESGNWLAMRYTFSYLSSGRDLLHFGWAGESQGAPVVVVAGPNYFMHGFEQSRRHWRQLSRTLGQADQICKLFPDSVLLTHDKATEEALFNLHGPRILHVATHGYFDAQAPGVQSVDIPLLRSGLILAGANGPPVGDQDGVLTALDVAGLDLWGTQLAVLSACETGLGDLVAGEGVAGLRRSLVLAGAESQLISLWRVSSAATGELMRGFYGRLQAGCGRAEALCARQREMLTTEDHSHPYYWAAFILSGAWHPLPAVAPVQTTVQ